MVRPGSQRDFREEGVQQRNSPDYCHAEKSPGITMEQLYLGFVTGFQESLSRPHRIFRLKPHASDGVSGAMNELSVLSLDGRGSSSHGI